MALLKIKGQKKRVFVNTIQVDALHEKSAYSVDLVCQNRLSYFTVQIQMSNVKCALSWAQNKFDKNIEIPLDFSTVKNSNILPITIITNFLFS